MVIRSDQMSTLGEASKERFVKRMVAHLEARFAPQLRAQGIAAPQLEPVVRAGVATAEGYGIVNETDLRSYLEFQAILGVKFDTDPRYPWAATILQNTETNGARKVDDINEQMLFGFSKHQ